MLQDPKTELQATGSCCTDPKVPIRTFYTSLQGSNVGT